MFLPQFLIGCIGIKVSSVLPSATDTRMLRQEAVEGHAVRTPDGWELVETD